MFNVYITGATGFIGNSLLKALSKKKQYNVKGICLGTNQTKDDIIYTDYKDTHWLQNCITTDNNIIIHCAAYIPTRYDNFFDKETLRINNRINHFLCDVFSGMDVSQLFYFSSIAVYGYGYKDLNNVSENDPLFIIDYYAESKQAGEKQIANSFNNSYILRLSSPYGENKKRKSILEKTIDSAIKGENINIFGEGRRTQDFIYINDICEVIDRLISQKNEYGIYNLASGHACSMIDLANTAIKVFKSSSQIIRIEKEENNFVSVNNNKLKSLTSVEFDDISRGLQKLYENKYGEGEG